MVYPLVTNYVYPDLRDVDLSCGQQHAVRFLQRRRPERFHPLQRLVLSVPYPGAVRWVQGR